VSDFKLFLDKSVFLLVVESEILVRILVL